MDNQQIQQMLGIDAGAAEATRAACDCLGLSAETAVKAIKCGLEAGGVSRADDGNWLIVDIGLYQWVLEQDASAKVTHIIKQIWDDKSPPPAASETSGAMGRGAALVTNGADEAANQCTCDRCVAGRETAVNGGGVG